MYSEHWLYAMLMSGSIDMELENIHNQCMDIQNALKAFGLKEKEITLYLKLAELGQATPLELSKKTDIKRPTAYVILQTLEQKGLVNKAVRERTTFYIAQHPKKLLIDAEEKLKDLRHIIPQLESFIANKKGGPRVFVFEGVDALDRAYHDAFSTKGEVLFMSTLQLSQKVFPRTFRRLENAVYSPEFRVRELVDESPEGRAYAVKTDSQYRSIRLIPKKYLPFETDIGIFGATTLITSAQKEYFFTVGVESEEIASAFRILYEVMWSISKKQP